MVLVTALRGFGRLEVGEMETPGTGPGEVLGEVGTNAVCGTETRILRGAKTRGIGRGVVLVVGAAGEALAQASPHGWIPSCPQGVER